MADTKESSNMKKVLKNLKKLQDMSVRWGVIGEENQKKLVFNEFGTVNIPERAAFRITFGSRQNQARLGKAAQKTVDQIINGVSPEKAALAIGEVGLADLKKTFRSSVPPPNEPSTIAKKGAGKNTLFDTGDLFRSLAFEVVSGQ